MEPVVGKPAGALGKLAEGWTVSGTTVIQQGTLWRMKKAANGADYENGALRNFGAPFA
jgi:hypothetical protein